LRDSTLVDAIDSVRIGEGCKDYEIQRAGINLTILSPLVFGVQRSRLLLVVDWSDRAHARFMMQVNAGNATRLLPALGNLSEVITRALDNESLPVVVEAELEERIGAYRAHGSADRRLHVPLRSLEVRKHLPRELARDLRDLALANAGAAAPKAQSLRPALQRIRTGLRDVVVRDYMMKCVWLNTRTGQLGTVSGSASGVDFVPFDADDNEISAFLCALQKDAYGDFLLDFREFATVHPTPKRANRWLGPTVHVYKSDFRAEHGLDEHYSLYAGFRALSAIGAPVLIYRGQNPLIEDTEMRFLKIADRSLHLLQGRILDGSALHDGVREFTAQSLVWKS
jgi:hypothetical protein